MPRRGTGSSKAAAKATADEWAALTVRERIVRAFQEGKPIDDAITKAVREAVREAARTPRRRPVRKAKASKVKSRRAK